MKKLNDLNTKENFKAMEEMINYVMNLKELNEEVYQELQGIESEGFYCPLTDEAFLTVPFGERWYVKYEVTYHMSVLLLQYFNAGHEEVYDQLISTLNASLSKGYKGHSYDSESVCLRYLTKLYKSGLKNIIMNNYHSLATDFGMLVYNYRKRLCAKKTSEGFGDIGESIKALLKVVDDNFLFVYGTLMDGEANSHYLDECPILGQGSLHGYQLLQLNGYPGIVKGDNEVIGEIYGVSEEVKKQIDLLEGSQYKYSSDFVDLCGASFYVHFYEFKMEPNKKYPLAYTKQGKWVNPKNYVWYASYGSNLLDDRFNKYIQKTTSQEEPLETRNIILPYDIYFAKRSSRWESQGVAFLDTTKRGFSYGHMYLITKEQYEEIRHLEGIGWYSKEVKITTDELNVPVLTITGKEVYPSVQPSKAYLEVIGAGIKQRYQLTDKEINDYLHTQDLNLNEKHLKEILRNK